MPSPTSNPAITHTRLLIGVSSQYALLAELMSSVVFGVLCLSVPDV
jgi:hypothetical protein